MRSLFERILAMVPPRENVTDHDYENVKRFLFSLSTPGDESVETTRATQHQEL